MKIYCGGLKTKKKEKRKRHRVGVIRQEKSICKGEEERWLFVRGWRVVDLRWKKRENYIYKR
jgi:hypothetical protein